MYPYFHTTVMCGEIIRAKHAFEEQTATIGIKIKNYHADNGRFQDIVYKED
jgi:hypothetical protein